MNPEALDRRAAGPVTRVALAEVALADVIDQLEPLRRIHCTRQELAELTGRHPRTTAGFLAAKEALCEVLAGASFSAGRRLLPSEVELGHDALGAPRLVALSSPGGARGLKLLGALSISISHTRDRAYGLAVLDEAACDDSGDLSDPRA